MGYTEGAKGRNTGDQRWIWRDKKFAPYCSSSSIGRGFFRRCAKSWRIWYQYRQCTVVRIRTQKVQYAQYREGRKLDGRRTQQICCHFRKNLDCVNTEEDKKGEGEGKRVEKRMLQLQCYPDKFTPKTPAPVLLRHRKILLKILNKCVSTLLSNITTLFYSSFRLRFMLYQTFPVVSPRSTSKYHSSSFSHFWSGAFQQPPPISSCLLIHLFFFAFCASFRFGLPLPPDPPGPSSPPGPPPSAQRRSSLGSDSCSSSGTWGKEE